MAQTLDISGSQINGARDYQEDAFLITTIGGSDEKDSASLVIVADGMGGHAAGNVASNMAVQTFNKHVTSHFPTNDVPAMLQEAVRAANASITDTVRETPALRGMGCTLVAALVVDQKLYWISVGDSHLYLLRSGTLEKKNVCHSYGGFLDRMAAAGRPVEPEAGFSRNMLMSALSGDEIAEVDCPDEPYALQSGDRIIMSTDGLDSLNAAKILSYSDGARGARDFVSVLLKGVEEAAIPRQDNTTVVVIDLPGRGERTANGKPVLKDIVAEGRSAERAAAHASGPAEFLSTPLPEPAPAPRPVRRAAKRTDPRDAYVRRSRWPLVLLLLALAGGGGAAYLYREQILANPTVAALLAGVSAPTTTTVTPAPEPEPEPEESSLEPSPTEPEPTPVPEAAPQPEPAVTTTPPPPPPIEEFRDGNGPPMVWVQGGSFEMGSAGSWPEPTEHPRHSVTLRRFAISRTEITNAQYAQFRQPPNPFGMGDSAPVAGISWNDAVAYARWLSAQTGKNYRLATEAEWEYAAAGGSDPQYWHWGRTPQPGMAHCFGCSPDLKPVKPVDVGSFSANAFGLYDTAGNVAEWVQDCYLPNYDGAPTDGSAREAEGCTERVVRGGSYDVPPKSIRAARRDKWPAERGHESIGFRVVREE
jgi:formylglycine-generating enzyme required for sulfatase activity/serine/threonine protein phosphatase PrpC